MNATTITLPYPKKSRDAFNQNAWRTKNYTPPEPLRTREVKVMAGVEYENFVGWEGDIAL